MNSLPSVPVTFYRHSPTGMTPDPAGQWAKATDVRHALNALQSQLRSTEIGGLANSHALVKRHKERGDMLRVWEIIGDPNQSGVREDVFERLQRIMAELAGLRSMRYREAQDVELRKERINGLSLEPLHLSGPLSREDIAQVYPEST